MRVAPPLYLPFVFVSAPFSLFIRSLAYRILALFLCCSAAWYCFSRRRPHNHDNEDDPFYLSFNPLVLITTTHSSYFTDSLDWPYLRFLFTRIWHFFFLDLL